MANKEKPGEPIDAGYEKTIYPDPTNKDRIVAKFHEYIDETPNQIKARYYLTKILHFLLPKNIPDIHWAGSKPNIYQVDRVEVDERHKILKEHNKKFTSEKAAFYSKNRKAYREFLDKGADTEKTISTDSDIINFQDKIDQLGVRSIDRSPINYTKDKEGNAIYLDSFYAWKFTNEGLPRLFFDFKTLEEAMSSLPETDKKTATNFLQRLKELYEEEKKLTEERDKKDDKEK